MNFVHTDDLVAQVPDRVGKSEAAGIKALGIAVGGLIAPGNVALGSDLAKYFGALEGKVRAGSTIQIDSGIDEAGASGIGGLAEHNHYLYTRDVLKLIEFATDEKSPFFKSEVGKALAAGRNYTGGEVAIGVGTSLNPDDVRSEYSYIIDDPLADDDFVLGNNGQNDLFRFNKATLVAKGNRVFDGGGADRDAVLLPLRKVLKGDGRIVKFDGGEILVDVKADETKDKWKSVGTFYRVEEIRFQDGKMEDFSAATKFSHSELL